MVNGVRFNRARSLASIVREGVLNKMRGQSKAEKFNQYFRNMERYGISYEDAATIRRIEMTLQRWAELECGDSNEYASWSIERDEETEKPYMVRHVHGQPDRTYRTRIADREAGALRRLDRLMAAYPDLTYYHQTDPRGCALYIVRKSDLPRDYFEVVRKDDGWTIQRKGSDTAYSGTYRTKAAAKAFAARETLSSYYTRGLAACV